MIFGFLIEQGEKQQREKGEKNRVVCIMPNSLYLNHFVTCDVTVSSLAKDLSLLIMLLEMFAKIQYNFYEFKTTRLV